MKSLILFLTVIGFTGPAWAEQKFIECENRGNQAGLESLQVVINRDLTMQANVSVSGPGGAFETYHYAVKANDPSTKPGAPQVYASANGKFKLELCMTCKPINGATAGKVAFVSPARAQIFPGTRSNYPKLSCTFFAVPE